MDGLGFLAGEPAFGDGLAESFDDLAGHAAEDPFGPLAGERFGFGAALGVQGVRDFSELLVTPATLQHLREVLPREVCVTARSHPLCGRVLMARGFRRLKGELMLAVVLPDGSAGTVPASMTDVFGDLPVASQLRSAGDVSQASEPLGVVLTAEGVRRLRALLAVGSRGSGRSRGTRRRAD